MEALRTSRRRLRAVCSALLRAESEDRGREDVAHHDAKGHGRWRERVDGWLRERVDGFVGELMDGCVKELMLDDGRFDGK